MKPTQYKIKEKVIKAVPITDRTFESIDIDDPVFPGRFKAEPPDNDFVNSIIDSGIIHPVVVAEYDDGTRELKVGRRRVWASRLAYTLCSETEGYEDDAQRVRLVPTMVYHSADKISAALWVLVENFQRGDNPIAELDAVKQLISENHLSTNGGWEDLGRAIGADKNYVKNLMNKWGKLPPTIIEGVREGKIAMGVAESATKLKKDQLDDVVDTYREKDTITGKDVSNVKRVQRDQEVSQVTMKSASKDWDNLLTQVQSPWEIFIKHLEGALLQDDKALRGILEQILKEAKTRTLK